MRISLGKLLEDFTGLPGASDLEIQAAENQCGVKLPNDYRAFLMQYGAGEGFIGKHYIILWKVGELQRFNEAYQVSARAPELLIFGSSGGGDGFAFDTRKHPYRVVQVAFIGMSLDDAYFVADSFTNLLERMFEIDGPLF